MVILLLSITKANELCPGAVTGSQRDPKQIGVQRRTVYYQVCSLIIFIKVAQRRSAAEGSS